MQRTPPIAKRQRALPPPPLLVQAAAAEPPPRPQKRARPVYRQAPIVDLVDTSRRSAFQFPRIQHLMNELPVCRFEFLDSPDAKLDQDELVAALRHATDTQRLVLPTFSCAYEAQLMREAGTFRIGGRSVTFPECRFGVRCVGRATGAHAIIGLGGDGAGVTLMALLFEGELATLLDTGAIDLRGNKRPCLLCYRHLLSDFLFSLQPRHSAPLGTTCIQIYSNLQVAAVGAGACNWCCCCTGRGWRVPIAVHAEPGAHALQRHCGAHCHVPAAAAARPARPGDLPMGCRPRHNCLAAASRARPARFRHSTWPFCQARFCCCCCRCRRRRYLRRD